MRWSHRKCTVPNLPLCMQQMKIAIAGGAQWWAFWNAGYRCEQISDVIRCMTDEGFVYQSTVCTRFAARWVTSATLGGRELHSRAASGRVQVSLLHAGLSVVMQVSTPEDPRGRRCSNQGATRWGRKPVWQRRHGRTDDVLIASDVGVRNMSERHARHGCTLTAPNQSIHPGHRWQSLAGWCCC